jgi:hypothetical protein
MRNVKDLDWSDVMADAERMEQEEQERLDALFGPMHWVMTEDEVLWDESVPEEPYWEDLY